MEFFKLNNGTQMPMAGIGVFIFDPSFNAYRVVGEIVGKAFSDGLKLK